MTDFLFRIYDHIANFFRSDFFRKVNLRTLIMIAVVIMTGCVLIYRLFVLQIVNGENYLDNFQLRIRREVSVSSTRGNIYDRNGKLLAYNELAYSVIMNDLGESSSAHDKELNSTIEEVIDLVERNGDSITSDFNVIYNTNTGHYE